MGLTIQKITNANVYEGANSLLGKVKEIELPNIQYMTAEHNALGMVGVIETFTGIEAMEATFRSDSIYNELIEAFADPFLTKKIQVRTSLNIWDSNGRSDQQPVVIHLSTRGSNMPLGSFNPKENIELEYTVKVTAVKMVVNGVEKFEFDAENNILKINGEDKLAQFRDNLGT